MPFETDLAYLREEMSPALFEKLIHEWAEQLRSLRLDAETKAGNGNGTIQWEQQVLGGHAVETWMAPPRKRFAKRLA